MKYPALLRHLVLIAHLGEKGAGWGVTHCSGVSFTAPPSHSRNRLALLGLQEIIHTENYKNHIISLICGDETKNNRGTNKTNS